MKITERLKEWIEHILLTPAEQLGRWAKFVRFQIGLWQLCARRLRENNALAMSSALSFRTIFAMIPAIVLALLVLKSVGALEGSKYSLRNLLDRVGLGQIAVVREAEPAAEEKEATKPAATVSLADEIEKLVAKVEGRLTLGRIGPVGVVLLIWTALTLLTTLERSLNRIFEAPRSRSLARRILIYWSVVTLGPVVLIAAAYAGAEAVKSFKSIPWASWVMTVIGWVGPAVVGILFLAAVYTLMPNTRVRFRSAVGGAIVAVPVWMLAKWGFSVYVTNLVGKGSLYGTLGLLPLFLMWLNVSWLILLFGAQLAYAADNLSRFQAAERARSLFLGPWELLATAIAVVRGYQDGKGPVAIEEISAKVNIPEESLRYLLDELAAKGVLSPVALQDTEAYVPARPAEKIPVLDVLEIAGMKDESQPAARFDAEIARSVARVQRLAETGLERISLADVMASEEA